MANSRRMYQVSEQIRSILALEIQQLADPGMRLVTITAVTVSKDLQYANVYWNVTDSKERAQEVEQAFARASGYLRKQLGGRLTLKTTPALRFFYDQTLDKAEEIEKLLQKANQGTTE